MPEDDRASVDRHAAWVALRTLRQRPTVVGRTERGERIYEVRSVRLLLNPEASHFKRLVQCAKCGTDMAGSSILTSDDLDRQSNPVFCTKCVRASPPVVATAPVRGEPAAQEDQGRRGGEGPPGAVVRREGRRPTTGAFEPSPPPLPRCRTNCG